MSYHSGYNSEADDANLSGSGNMFYFGQVSFTRDLEKKFKILDRQP